VLSTTQRSAVPPAAVRQHLAALTGDLNARLRAMRGVLVYADLLVDDIPELAGSLQLALAPPTSRCAWHGSDLVLSANLALY
jgi:hypothetical protein